MTARIDPNVLKETVHGERGLVLQMILDAEDHVKKPKGIESYRWVSDTTSDGPFSFIWCCQVLGVDPDACRERILANKAKKYSPLKSAGTMIREPALIPKHPNACVICHWKLKDSNQAVCKTEHDSQICVARNPTGAIPGAYKLVEPCEYCGSKLGSRYRKVEAAVHSKTKAWMCRNCFVGSRNNETEKAIKDAAAEREKAIEIHNVFKESGLDVVPWAKFIELYPGPQSAGDTALRVGIQCGYLTRVSRGNYALTGKQP